MLAFFDELIRIVGPGILVGAAVAFLVLRLIDWRLHRIKGTEGREFGPYEDNPAEHARAESGGGGAVGFPVLREDGHVVRVIPEGAKFRVERTRDGDTLSQFVLDGDGDARAICQLLIRQVEEGVEIPGPDPTDAQRDVFLRWSQGLRQVAALRVGARFKVVDILDRELRGASWTATEQHARELFQALVGLRGAARDGRREVRASAKPIADEAITGGEWDERDAAERESHEPWSQPVSIDLDDPEFDRLFE